MAKKFNISHNGRDYGQFEVLKSCRTSLGYEIYLFRSCVTNPRLTRYIVAVKRGEVTIAFKPMLQFDKPFTLYLDYICCYA